MNKKKLLLSKVSDVYEITPYDTIKTNQLIPDSIINLSTSTSSVPSSNVVGSYISKWLTVENRVGHKVYAKIITSNNRLRCVWYKNSSSGYDFVTGQLVNGSSSVPSMTEGIYTVTADMVYSDGYAQLYYFVYAGMPTGSHSVTLQLTDLTEIYGAGNEPTNLVTLKAQHPELKLVNKYGYRLIGAGEWRGNQLIKNGNFVNLENWEPRGTTISVENNILHVSNGWWGANYPMQDIIGLDKNHKVFVTGTFMATKNVSNIYVLRIDYANSGTESLIANQWKKVSYIVSFSNQPSILSFRGTSQTLADNVELFVKDVMLVDLTYLYGAGSEPATVEQFLTDHPEYNHYVEYAPLGTVRNQLITNNGTIINLSAPLYKVGNVADAIRTNVGENRKFGVVDLGSLKWTLNNTAVSLSVFRSNDLLNIAKKSSGMAIQSQLLCPKYKQLDRNTVVKAMADKAISIGGVSNDAGAYLNVVDTDYTDAASFKTAMSGVLLIYELATPTQTIFPSPYKLTSITSVTDGFKPLTVTPAGKTIIF